MCYGRDGCGLPVKKKEKKVEKSFSARGRASEEVKRRQEGLKKNT